VEYVIHTPGGPVWTSGNRVYTEPLFTHLFKKNEYISLARLRRQTQLSLR